MIFERLESPPETDEGWQPESEKMVYLHSIDRSIQPDDVKNKLCAYDMGSASDLNYCKVDKDGVGGYLSMETESDFKQHYHKIGK